MPESWILDGGCENVIFLLQLSYAFYNVQFHPRVMLTGIYIFTCAVDINVIHNINTMLLGTKLN